MKYILIFLFVFLSVISLANEETWGLVLSGGGAKGAYEIGVWKALLDLDFELGGVYGTSVGAINSAAVAQGDLTKAVNLWKNLKDSDVMVMTPEVKKLLDQSGIKVLTDIIKLPFKEIENLGKTIVEQGIINTDPLKKTLDAALSEEKIRNSSVNMGLVTFDVTELKPKMLYVDEIPQGQLIDFVIASGNFPLFVREKINGQKYMDGGVYYNMPIKMAVNKGFKKVIAVQIGGERIGLIINALQMFKLDEYIYIAPRVIYGSVLDFSPENSLKMLIEGYLDTLHVNKYVSGDYTYIMEDKNIIKSMYDSLSDSEKSEALKIAGPLQFYRTFDHMEKSLLEKYSMGDPVNLWNFIFDDIACSLSVNPLNLYNGEKIVNEISKISKTEQKYKEGNTINGMTLRDIVNFFNYLSEKSSFEENETEKYQKFSAGIDFFKNN